MFVFLLTFPPDPAGPGAVPRSTPMLVALLSLWGWNSLAWFSAVILLALGIRPAWRLWLATALAVLCSVGGIDLAQSLDCLLFPK